MGEWSKKIGEDGERIVGQFLTLIGWMAAQKGVTIPCIKPDQHTSSSGSRVTHGTDYLMTYRSSLTDALAQNLVISVKYSDSAYPASPNRIFQAHFKELAQTIECFKHSEKRRDAVRAIKGVTRAQDIGVLFWINNEKFGSNDIISKVLDAKISDTSGNEPIYLVDNARMAFIFDSLEYARSLAQDCTIEFFYPDTGKNINPLTHEKHGRTLPVEYINGGILPIRIAKRNATQKQLMIFCIENFSEFSLKQLMGLAQSLSQGWCDKVIICFPDFNSLRHDNIFQSAKSAFANADFVTGLEVHCYDSDFRNSK